MRFLLIYVFKCLNCMYLSSWSYAFEFESLLTPHPRKALMNLIPQQFPTLFPLRTLILLPPPTIAHLSLRHKVVSQIIRSKFGLAYLDVALYISRHIDPASRHLRSFRFNSVARSTTWKRIQASPARCFVCESKFRGQNREVECSECSAYYPMQSQPL